MLKGLLVSYHTWTAASQAASNALASRGGMSPDSMSGNASAITCQNAACANADASLILFCSRLGSSGFKVHALDLSCVVRQEFLPCFVDCALRPQVVGFDHSTIHEVNDKAGTTEASEASGAIWCDNVVSVLDAYDVWIIFAIGIALPEVTVKAHGGMLDSHILMGVILLAAVLAFVDHLRF